MILLENIIHKNTLARGTIIAMKSFYSLLANFIFGKKSDFNYVNPPITMALYGRTV